MMYGIPLLAVMDEGDIVSDIEAGAGCWARNGESEKLAELIRELAANPEKVEKMRQTCRQLYLEKYTTDICTEKYVSLLRKLG